MTTTRPINHYDGDLCAAVLEILEDVYDIPDWLFLLERYSHKSDEEYARILNVSRSRVWRRRTRLLESARDHLSVTTPFDYDVASP